MRFKLVILLLAITLSTAAYAQTAADQKYRLAASYEKSGALEDAKRLYRELYNSDPKSGKYFAALARVYKTLNRHSDLLWIVEKRIETNESCRLLSLYGETLWNIGHIEKANKAWQKALSNYSDSQNSYRIVAGTQSKLRQIDKAIATLKRGRNTLNIDSLYSDELCNLFIAAGNYRDGTEEILNNFYYQRNLPRAQGRLYALMIDENAQDYILKRIGREARANPGHLSVQSIYSFILRTLKQYEQALRVVERIDRLKGSKGREILAFADQSRKDGQLQIALQAYGIIIDDVEFYKRLPSALFGYARTLEQTFNSKKIPRAEAEKIIGRYKEIIKKYPNKSNAADSRFRIAKLALYHIEDYQRAVTELQTLIGNYPRARITAAATILLGDIYLIEDKIENAEASYKKTIRKFQKTAPSEAARAQYKLAEIRYFLGEIDSAAAMFALVANKSKSDAANDALDKIVLIEQNKDFPEALKSFAGAEFMAAKKNLAGAKELFLKTSELVEGENLAEKSLLRAAEIEINNEAYSAAREILKSHLEKYSDSIYGDYILLLTAGCFKEENDKQSAMKAYTEILINYPRSIYLQQARDSIRSLRNEKIY